MNVYIGARHTVCSQEYLLGIFTKTSLVIKKRRIHPPQLLRLRHKGDLLRALVLLPLPFQRVFHFALWLSFYSTMLLLTKLAADYVHHRSFQRSENYLTRTIITVASFYSRRDILFFYKTSVLIFYEFVTSVLYIVRCIACYRATFTWSLYVGESTKFCFKLMKLVKLVK